MLKVLRLSPAPAQPRNMYPEDGIMGLLSTVGEYSNSDFQALPRDTRVIFAESPHVNFISANHGLEPHRKSLSEKQWEKMFASIGAIRCERSQQGTFSAYPTSERAVQCNKFLWQAVQKSSFSTAAAADLFGKNVYCISLPEGLHRFLASVPWKTVEETLVYVLATIAEDEEGAMNVLENELASSLYEKVRTYCRREVHAEPPVEFRAMMDHVFNFIFSLGPWTIPVSLSYISAEDIALLEAGEAPTALKRGSDELQKQNAIMYKLYVDFRIYERFLCPKFSRVELLDVMARVIAGKNHLAAWLAVDELLLSVRNGTAPKRKRPKRSLLGELPLEVVLDCLIPSLILRYADDVPKTASEVPRSELQVRETISMEDVDAKLDAEEQEDSTYDGVEIGREEGNPFQACTSPSPWNLKFMLLEHRTLLQHYYGIPVGDFEETDDDTDSDEDLGDARDELRIEEAFNESQREQPQPGHTRGRSLDILDVTMEVH